MARHRAAESRLQRLRKTRESLIRKQEARSGAEKRGGVRPRGRLRSEVEIPAVILAIGAVLCVLPTLGCGVLAHDLSRFTVTHLAAAYDQAGETGTVAVTDRREVVSGRGHRRLQCSGTFTPEGDGPVRTEVVTHVSADGCDIGRTERARFVDSSGIAAEFGAGVYVPGATSAWRYYHIYFVLLVPLVLVAVTTPVSAVPTLGFTRELLRAPFRNRSRSERSP